MTRDDLVRFAERDWAAIEDGKALYWAERKHALSPADALRLGAGLRHYVSRMRPDWPSDAERLADHDTHERVAEALRAVARATH